jgi:flagellar hook-associated protein 2
VTVGSDIVGNESFLGTMDVAVEGRKASTLVAENVAGEIQVRAADFGAAAGFTIALTAGGTDGTGSLGLAPGTYQGTDIVGTIGGEAATGLGAVLTAAAGTAADGLAVRAPGSGVGSLGSVTYSRGVAESMSQVLKALLGTEAGSVTAIQEGLDRAVDRLTDRVDRWEDRLVLKREQLVRKFTALEEAMARAQSQSAWLTQQFASLNGINNG